MIHKIDLITKMGPFWKLYFLCFFVTWLQNDFLHSKWLRFAGHKSFLNMNDILKQNSLIRHYYYYFKSILYL